MIHRWLIGRMVIVRQEIEPVEMFVQLWHIVTFLDIFKASWHCHGEEETGSTSFVMFTLKLFAQLLHELCIILTIFRLSAIAICGIFCEEFEEFVALCKR